MEEKTSDQEQQDQYEQIQRLKTLAHTHILRSVFPTDDGIDTSLPCFKQPTDPEFEMPSKAIVSKTVDVILAKGYTKNDISDFLGLNKNGNNRLLNYWMKEGSDGYMKKGNWILLASLAGLMFPLMVEDKN